MYSTIIFLAYIVILFLFFTSKKNITLKPNIHKREYVMMLRSHEFTGMNSSSIVIPVTRET